MAIRALMAGIPEEVAAEIASLPSAILTVLVEALKKRERTLSKRTQGRRARTG